jgi:hypothetical protein
MAELTDRQVAHRRRMLEHLGQRAIEGAQIAFSFSAASQEGSEIAVVATTPLTHRIAMDTIERDER